MVPTSGRAGRATAAFTKLSESYARTFAYCLLISALVHALYMFLGFGPSSRPYQLRERRMQVIDIPDPIYIPPPPPEVVRPEIPPPAEESVEVEDEDEEPLPSTRFNPIKPPMSAPPPPSSDEAFLAFDTPPRVIEAVEPRYPALAVETFSQGTVHVQVTVDEAGRVINAVVLNSTVIDILEEAALAAAKKTRFSPAKQRDVPVKSRVVLPYRFTLRSN